MLVYGERSREVDTQKLIASLIEREAKLERERSALRYHLDLVRMMVEYGELMQGLADASDIVQGYTQQGKSQLHNLGLQPHLGSLFHTSCVKVGIVPPIKRQTNYLLTPMGAFMLETAIMGRKLPPQLTIKPLEGFAYYSVYPETYAQVAMSMAREHHRRQTVVIGILSMGAILAEVVAGALRQINALKGQIYVRPHGHPYARQLQLVDERMWWLKEAIKEQRPFAIVDEGPGLSGSSFGAVADWLEAQGLARERIVFFPSHDNPLGPQASEAHRERWASARKYVASFESVFIETGRLAEWVSDITGGVGEMEDIGYGRWRARLLPHQEDWPPVNIQQERRKYLCNAGGRQWLLKFVGLGHYGEDKLPLARSLAEAGFITPLVGLQHGFSVSEWLAEAKPLTNALLGQIDRTRLVDFVAAYLAHRARHFPAPAGSGATGAQLFEMMRYNTAQSIGEQYATRLNRWQAQLDELAADERRVLTDNKMQPWEWLLLPDGRLQKADALDHHASHDLVGAQDIAWDIVGAIIELNLSREEATRLLAAFAAGAGEGYRPSNQQLAFYTYAYIAFQVGYYTLSAQALAGEAEEATLLREWADAWAWLLGERIDLPPQYELE